MNSLHTEKKFLSTASSKETNSQCAWTDVRKKVISIHTQKSHPTRNLDTFGQKTNC